MAGSLWDILTCLYYYDLGKMKVSGKIGLTLVFTLTCNDECVTIRLKEMI